MLPSSPCDSPAPSPEPIGLSALSTSQKRRVNRNARKKEADRASLEQIVMSSSDLSAKRQVSCSMKAIRRIVRLAFLKSDTFYSPEESRKEGLIYLFYWVAALAFLGVYSWTYYEMSVTAGDFLTIISDYSTNYTDFYDSQQQFYTEIWHVVLYTLASSICYTAMLMFAMLIAVVWRQRITHYLFELYFQPYVFYEINHNATDIPNNKGQHHKQADSTELKLDKQNSLSSSATVTSSDSGGNSGAACDPKKKSSTLSSVERAKRRRKIDNVDQRLSNDIRLFSINLANYLFGTLYFNGVLSTFTSALSFSIGLFQNGDGLELGISFGSFFLFVAINAIIGSFVAQSNYRAESASAFYNFSHNHLRTHAEHVAFYNGQEEEKAKLLSLLSYAVKRSMSFIRRTFALNFVTNLYYWLATVLCYALPGAIFFSISSDQSETAATSLYNATVLSSYLQLTFSYAILLSESQSNILSYGSRVGELLEELELISADSRQTSQQHRHWGDHVEFKNVSCLTPSGTVLVKNLSLSIQGKKENLIIMGVSGSGKSSILRILCGLWPVEDGEIERPKEFEDGCYFVPQKPYLTLGTLREQFSYPRLKKHSKPKGVGFAATLYHTFKPSKALSKTKSRENSAIHGGFDSVENSDSESDEWLSDDEIAQLLALVDLDYLLDRFSPDSIADWSTVLSVGEQQRIGMARLFYHQPAFALLDESTSAVDVDLERKFYQQCLDRKIQFISVAHRPSCIQYHHVLLKLKKNGEYEISTIAQQTDHAEEKADQKTPKSAAQESSSHSSKASVDGDTLAQLNPPLQLSEDIHFRVESMNDAASEENSRSRSAHTE